MSDRTERDDPAGAGKSIEAPDPARRKLLRAAAAAGGGFALGQIPWEKPAVRSFFGQRAAWAQPTGPSCNTLVTTALQLSASTPSVSFQVSNTGAVPVELTAINSSNPAFSLTSPALPVTIDPGSTVNGSVSLSCSVAGVESTVLSFTANAGSLAVGCPSLELEAECFLRCSVSPTTLEITDDMCDQAGTTGTFTIENTGDIPFDVDELNIINAVPDDPFTDLWEIVSPASLPVTLLPGETLDVTVRYTCCESEGGSADVDIVTSSASGPASCSRVALTGNCIFRGE